MTLVDTSIWIEVFRKHRPLDLEALVPLDRVATCLPVIQEVLQGFRDEAAYRIARQSMFDLEVIEDPMGGALFEEAVALFRAARRMGITVRSSVDCLIAAAALRHDFEVLHRDRDFASLAKICPLRQRQA
jgi:predicted nucleic acid-binding protein